MLNFGIFENLKGADTLLIWGDAADLVCLQRLFSDLASGQRSVAALANEPWAHSVNGDRLELTVAAVGRGTMRLKRQTGERIVEWSCAPMWFEEFAAKIASLAASDHEGHQYLDAPQAAPIQVMVSKGEYPADLRP